MLQLVDSKQNIILKEDIDENYSYETLINSPIHTTIQCIDYLNISSSHHQESTALTGESVSVLILIISKIEKKTVAGSFPYCRDLINSNVGKNKVQKNRPFVGLSIKERNLLSKIRKRITWIRSGYFYLVFQRSFPDFPFSR